MLRLFFSSLRTRLIILVIVAVVPCLALVLYTGFEQRRSSIEDAKEDALKLAREISKDHQDMIETMRQTLFTLSQFPGMQDRDKSSSTLFAKLLQLSDGVNNFLACDEDGEVFASGVPFDQPVNSRDREWFQRSIQTRGFTVGGFQVGRITNKPQINMSYPVIDDAGRIRAVVVAALDLRWIERQVAGAAISSGMTCTVIDRHGTILVHYPGTEEMSGKSIAELEFVKTMLSGGQGVVEAPGLDGMQHLFGYASVGFGAEGICFFVGIPRDVAFAEANRRLGINLALLVAATLAALMLTRFIGERSILRQIDAVLEASREVAGGNLAARTRLPEVEGELGQLTLSFDRMAESLQQREAERHLAEDRLRQANEYLENVFESSPDGIGIVDTHGKFIRWNRMAAEQFGYEFEELGEKSAFDFYADKDQLETLLAELRRGGAIVKRAVDMKKKDGGVATFEISISLLRDESDEVIGSVCVARDLGPLKLAYDQLQNEIAERKMMEEALMESERRFRDVLEGVHLIAVSIDVRGRIFFCNNHFQNLVGWDYGDILNRDWFDTFLPELHRDTFRLIFERAIADGEIPAHFEGEIITPRGEKKLILWNNTLLTDLKGNCIGATCIGQDISEIRKAEEELRRTYTELEQLIASMPSFLIGLTPDSRISKWNSSAERTFGIAAEDVIGNPLGGCGIGWDWKVAEEAVSMCRDRNVATRLDDVRFVSPEGKERFLEITINPVKGSASGPSGVLLLGSDITRRKIMESQLVQAQKLESIGQLAAGIAHEINTPAQYVGDNTRFLQEAFEDLKNVQQQYDKLIETVKSCKPADEQVRAIEALADKIDLEYLREEIPNAVRQSLEGIERISRIVRAMKEFSHPGTDAKKEIDLNKAIESTVTVARNEWKYVADMTTDFDPSMPLVPCMPGEFNQVILNMIVNAAHAIAETLNGDGRKGMITISTRALDECVEVRVGDTGAGIREDIRSRIFDPFFTTKEVGKGTGQGLAISRDVIVEKHGGTIDFETELGKGTTFVVRMPLANASCDKVAG